MVDVAPAKPIGLERPIRASRQGRAGSKSEMSLSAVIVSAPAKPKPSRAANLDRPSEAKRARAVNFERPSEIERAPEADPSAPAMPSKARRADFARLNDAERGPRGRFRMPQRGGAGSSGPELGNVGSCGVFEQAEPS